MSTTTIRIPVKAWYGDEEMELQFPSGWDVNECRMVGHDTPALDQQAMRAALAEPLGTKPLRELARGRKQAVILFDDLTRPAPTSRILPLVLEELAAAGFADDQIRFIGAFANHAAMCQEDFIKKLGADVVRRFRIYNHNPYEHLEKLGTTKRGTPVLINREVMACDLKIAIGGLIPHVMAGFGGGAKMVVPGVAGIETVAHNHGVIAQRQAAERGQRMLGEVEGNDARDDLEEAAAMVGLDFKIDLLINYRREIVGVFAGHYIEQHRAGVETAKRLYATAIAPECDIVVNNAFPIENQLVKGLWPADASLKKGGTAVLVARSVEGQAMHYLGGRFGSDYGGALWQARKPQPVIANAAKILFCTEHHARTDLDAIGPDDVVVVCPTWSDVLIHLMRDHGAAAKVGVYPYASIQYPMPD